MKRRTFITLLGGAAATWPLAVHAQQPERSRRIGVLLSVAESDPEGKAQLSGFTLGLAELGWIDGRNLRMEVRWGGGEVDQIRTFAKELVALQPDLIVAQGTPVTAALQRETRTIPIVFVVVTDPVGDGFVAGLSHPGGNITGFLTSESAITAKMFELLTEIAPGLRRVAMLFNPDTAPGGRSLLLPRFRGCCPIDQSGADRSARPERSRNRSHHNLPWTRARRWPRCHARLLYGESCWTNHIARGAKQCTSGLSLEIRRR